jgi:tetratricopeptide (TPR) repeat protein
MRWISIGLVLALVALPAWAQGRNQNWTSCADKNPDLSIAGCTAVIQSTGQEMTEGYAIAYFKRGDAYYRKGLYDRALADETQAISLKPDFADAYGARGQTYEQQGRRDQAIADYRAALRLAADHPKLYASVSGLAQESLKRLGAAP